MLPRMLACLTFFTLVVPGVVGASTSADFVDAGQCRLARQGLGFPDCVVTHEGWASLVSCDAAGCILDVGLTAGLRGALPGQATLVASVLGDTTARVCGAERLGLDSGGLECSGSLRVALVVPSACRHVVIETVGTVDGLLVGESASEVIVCRDGTIREA